MVRMETKDDEPNLPKWANSAKCRSGVSFPQLALTSQGAPTPPGHRFSLLCLPTPSQHLTNPRHGPSPCSVPDTSDPEGATAHSLSSVGCAWEGRRHRCCEKTGEGMPDPHLRSRGRCPRASGESGAGSYLSGAEKTC